jgi:hypothetical protein
MIATCYHALTAGLAPALLPIVSHRHALPNSVRDYRQ